MAGVKMVVDHVDALVRSVSTLTKQQVLVGIPEESADRDPQDGGAINNATLGYIHEFGAPAANIPARPHLVPGVRAYTPRAIARLRAAAQAAMDLSVRQASAAPVDVRQAPSIVKGGASSQGNPEREVLAQLNAVGLEAVVEVKKQITEGDLAPLKPQTIAARKRKGFEGERPLVMTGDYLRHINYVLRKTK